MNKTQRASDITTSVFMCMYSSEMRRRKIKKKQQAKRTEEEKTDHRNVLLVYMFSPYFSFSLFRFHFASFSNKETKIYIAAHIATRFAYECFVYTKTKRNGLRI